MGAVAQLARHLRSGHLLDPGNVETVRRSQLDAEPRPVGDFHRFRRYPIDDFRALCCQFRDGFLGKCV